MAIQRNLRKSKSWLQKTGDRIDRGVKGTDIQSQRKVQVTIYYKLWRNLKYLKERHHFDLANRIKTKLPKNGKLNLLDSGAGFMGVSADLKQQFGSKIFVTALNVVHPASFKEGKKATIKQLENFKNKNRTEEKQTLEKFLQRVKTAEKNGRIVDSCRVSPIETFSTKKRFQVILDFYGPMTYSLYSSRVLQ